MSFSKDLKKIYQKNKRKASILYGKWVKLLEEKKLTTNDLESELTDDELIEGIFRAIAGFISMLDEMFHEIDHTRRSKARVCMRTEDEKVLALWHKNKKPLSKEINVEDEFVYCLGIFGEIKGEAADILAKLFASEVIHGQLQLPGYKNLSQGLYSICLTKLDLSVQAELAQIEQSETS